MNHLTSKFRFLPATGLAAMLSACQPTNSGSVDVDNNGVSLTPPPVIATARNVNRDELSPFVQVDGTPIDMVREGELWSGQVLVEPNNDYVLTIVWSEALPQGDLQLATLNTGVFVGSDGEVVQNLAPNEYSTNIDQDGDGFTNLVERENESDPFLFDSTPIGDTGAPLPVPEPEPEPEEMEPVDSETPDPDPVPDEMTPVPVELPIPDPEEETEEETEEEPEPTPDPEETPEEVEEPEEEDSSATVTIPRISASNAPEIDGLGVIELASDGSLLGEWSAAVEVDDNGVILGINNLMIDDGTVEESDGDPHRRWAAMHDGTRLYILVLVDDIGLRFGDSTNIWDDDAVELYIDGDNSKLATWGDDDDFQFLISMLTSDGDANISTESGARVIRGRQSSDDSIDLEFATGPGIGPDGIQFPRFEQDVYELSFDLEDAGITIGEDFGFELQINEDDNGNGRDAKWGWFHPSRNGTDTDTTFQIPSVMGTVVLGE